MTVIELRDYADHIRENVRLVMRHRGYTNQRLADELGLSLSQVQDRTTLKTARNPTNWSAPELAAVAEILNVPVFVLYESPEEAWSWISSQLGKPLISCNPETPGQTPPKGLAA